MIRTIAVLVAVAAAALPAAAVAGDSTCVWRALPETARTQTLSQFAKGGGDELFKEIPDEVLGTAVLKCVSLPKREKDQEQMFEAVAVALGGYVMQLGSEQALTGKLRIEPSALERGYSKLSPKLRKDLASATMAGKDPSKAVVNSFFDAILAAYPDGDPDKLSDADIEQFFLYFSGRAVREQYEAKF